MTYLKNSLLPKNWYWLLPILPTIPFLINRIFFLKNQMLTLIFWEIIAFSIAISLSEHSPFREFSTQRLFENFIEDNGFYLQFKEIDKIKHSISIEWVYNNNFLEIEVDHRGVYYPNFEHIPHLLSSLFKYSLYEVDELPNGNLFIILFDDSIEEFDSTESWKQYE